VALALAASVVVEPEAAEAVPILPGVITCPVGTWTGTITFVPPLTTVAANFSPIETVKVNAHLKCAGTTGTLQKGHLTGKATFTSPTGVTENDCNTIIPAAVGGANPWVPATTPTWKTVWTAPVGVPTKFKFTTITVNHLAGNLVDFAIANTAATGSFPAGFAGNETLTGPGGWSYAAWTAACATAVGLGSASLTGSSGSW